MARGSATELQVRHIRQCSVGDKGGYQVVSGLLRHLSPGQGGREHLLGRDIQAATGQPLHQQGPGATRRVGDQPKWDLIFPKAVQRYGGAGDRSGAGIEGPVQVEQEGLGPGQGIFPS
jgi:hypothetical protein